MKNQHPLVVLLAGFILLCGCGKKADPSANLRLAPDAQALAALPIPADLPPCPGIVAIGDVSGDRQAGTAVLFSGKPVATLLDVYTSSLAADGWIMGSAFEQDSEHHLQFARGPRFLRIQIGPSAGPGTTRLFLIWKNPATSGASRDSYAPDNREAEPDASATGSREW